MAKRNKYINSFDTTSEFENYIESAAPGFPNVALTKDDGEIHYTRTSPNSHIIYGTISDATLIPAMIINDVTVNCNVNDNYFYIDESDLTSSQLHPTKITFYTNKSNVTSIRKWTLDMSSVTNTTNMFNGCSILTSLDLTQWDTSSLSTMTNMFNNCSSLTDVYITVESTLNKLTNNLTSQGGNYIPSSATIHYNGTDYTWSGSAWTAQS